MTARRLGLVLAAVLIVSHGGAAARAANPGANGRLLIASGSRHEQDLSGLDLRTHRSLELFPYGGDVGGTYSPDGTKIAFMSNIDGDLEIFTMNADGSGVRQLTKNSWADDYPSWSPDGKQLAFASNRDGDWDIWVMNADGTHPVNLTNADPGVDDAPHWSPDGRWIAYQTNQISWNIVLMRPDGSDSTDFAWNDHINWFDSWSPDGQSLLVDSNVAGDYDIYRYDLPPVIPTPFAWFVPTVVSNDAASEGPAIWSPDGKQIAITSNRDGDFDVYVMNADGGPQTKLTHNSVDDVAYDWQPLHDVQAPVARVFPARLEASRSIEARYAVVDDSGKASVELLGYKGTRVVAYAETTLLPRQPGRVYTVRLRTLPHLHGTVKLCVRAHDPSGNESARTCAQLRIH